MILTRVAGIACLEILDGKWQILSVFPIFFITISTPNHLDASKLDRGRQMVASVRLSKSKREAKRARNKARRGRPLSNALKEIFATSSRVRALRRKLKSEFSRTFALDIRSLGR
jgi:hypothetical protein